MSDPAKAVFLSYASQDAEAARRICDALRAAGVEVWFDQSELRGGDTWDHKIRKQIKECALFMPVISATTQARGEGYFRLEWKLAVDRSHLMADDAAFLFPVVIDDISDAAARVPDKFRDVQWTRLSVKDTPESLAVRVGKLLTGASGGEERASGRVEDGSRRRQARSWMKIVMPLGGLLVGVIYALKPLWTPPVHKDPGAARATQVERVAPVSEARQLAAKAQELFLGLDSTKDDFALAEDMLKQAVAKASGDAEVWATFAQLHQRYGARGWDSSSERREASRSATQRALRLDPQSFEARFAATGFVTGAAKEVQEHEQLLRALLRERPADKRVLRALGNVLRVQPETRDEAIHLYERSAQLPGGDPLALYNKALALWYVGRSRDAQASLAASMAQQPFIGSRLLSAYFALSLDGDLDRGQSLIAQLPASTFQEDRGCYFAYMVFRYRNEPDRALAAVQGLPRDWLNDNWFRGPRGALAGNALAQAGRPEAAAVEWRAALKIVEQRLAANPNDLPALGSRAILLGSLGDLAAARPLLPTLRQMLQLDQPGVLAPTWFIQASLLAGERAEALRLIGAVLQSSVHATILTAADLRHDPTWTALRDDPEFIRLIAEAERIERADAEGPAKAAQPAAVNVDAKSVAVLAFTNLSDDKNNEYFSDGISEELLNVVAKIPGLKVPARTSAFYFKGKDVPVGEIARQLGVAYVIEGSVRKSGDKVRITAELIKASDGFQVWSDTFTRDLKDIFAVQDEIAALVARNLQLKLGAATRVTVSVDPEAYRLYLQGRQALLRRTEEGFDVAEKYFQRARAMAPEWAPIYAGLADVGRFRSFNGNAFGPDAPWSPTLTKAKALAEQALVLDPNLPEADVALAGTFMLGGNLPEAERLVVRALELNPNLADAYLVLGRVHSALGKMDESLAAFQRAADLNPFAPRILDNLACQHFMAGHYAEGWSIIERASALQPDGVQIQCYRARLLTVLGRREEALRQARQLVDNPDPEAADFRWLEAAGVYAAFGPKSEAEALAAKISPGRSEKVIAYGYLGRPAEAIPTLGQINFSWIDDLLWGRGFDPIRNDPRYLAYLAKVGLTEANTRARAWRAAHEPKSPDKP